MPFILTPKEASADGATVRLTAIDEPVDFNAAGSTLSSEGKEFDLRGGWENSGQAVRIQSRSFTLQGLGPGVRREVVWHSDQRELGRAELSTFPHALPTVEQDPFVVFLGSCFWYRKDLGLDLAVGLLRALKPHVKILSGDQVYLDAPASHYATNTHDRQHLERRFLDTYLATWGKFTGHPGLRPLLASGANYFCADDHELWNNAPNRAALVRDSWTEHGRRDWLDLARLLFAEFQAAAPVQTFSAGSLSFCIADTRLDRDADEKRFMRGDDMAAVVEWIRTLDAPGVLVLGQPIFAEPAGWFGHLTDWSLADYSQYQELVGALMGAQHDIVVLTGDVHYARAATCRLPSGRNLYEIISSPMALVDEWVGRKWHAAPERFPAKAISGLRAADVEHLPHRASPFKESNDHFVTLECQQAGAHVLMRALCWPVGKDRGRSREICRLQLM